MNIGNSDFQQLLPPKVKNKKAIRKKCEANVKMNWIRQIRVNRVKE